MNHQKDLPHPSVPPSQSNQRARDIVNRPQFHRPGESLITRAQRWILNRIADLFGTLGGSGLGAVIAWVFLAAAIGGVVVLIGRMMKSNRSGKPARVALPARASTVVDESVSPARWRELADDHAAAGRWREALRCRYRALVGDLARRSLLNEIPGRTTGEERRELAASAPEASSPFDEATELFDETWYGSKVADARDASHFESLEREVLDKALR